MIYTLTYNPSLDYRMEVDELLIGNVNRSTGEYLVPGGKGINVSIVLRNLGIKSVVLGYVAGFTGDKIEEELKNKGIDTRFIHLEDGLSRVNVKIRNNNGITEINANGPKVSREDIKKLYEILDKINSEDVLVLAGNSPDELYENILKYIGKKCVKVVVDATGKQLLNTLKYKPMLIKPNHHELGEIYGVHCDTVDDVVYYAKKLKEEGACNVLVSRAEKDAVLVDERGDVHICKVPNIKVVNSVGAGDSMVAGYIAKWIEEHNSNNEVNYDEILRYAVAAGSASASLEGLAGMSDINNLLNNKAL